MRCQIIELETITGLHQRGDAALGKVVQQAGLAGSSTAQLRGASASDAGDPCGVRPFPTSPMVRVKHGRGSRGDAFIHRGFDKILKGAKRADIPVAQPTKIDLAINPPTPGEGNKVSRLDVLKWV